MCVQDNLFAVKDSRNGREQGPYTLQDALKLATDLNSFIQRNAGMRTAFRIVPSTEKVAYKLCATLYTLHVLLSLKLSKSVTRA